MYNAICGNNLSKKIEGLYLFILRKQYVNDY